METAPTTRMNKKLRETVCFNSSTVCRTDWRLADSTRTDVPMCPVRRRNPMISLKFERLMTAVTLFVDERSFSKIFREELRDD